MYGRTYRDRPEAVALDPYNLPLSSTPAETTDYGGIFGALRDASPDAWGRRLIEASLGRPNLTEVDYLMHARHQLPLTYSSPIPTRAEQSPDDGREE